MKIVAFSINPLFPDRVMGGAPKHLQNIAVHLGELGHAVEVLCTRAGPDQQPFDWHPNVRVRPVLRFKQPFPQPYDTPAYHLANAIQEVADALADADRFYMHDGELLFPPIYRHVPTAVSLRDSVYPETQLGAFLFQGDELITISQHSHDYYLHTVGRFFPDLSARMRIIPNGIDWNIFRPTSLHEVLELIPVDPQRDAIVLHPHRPEPSKGLPQTIAVADLLVHRHGVANLKVLAPRWLEVGLSPEVRAFYAQIQAEIAARGLQDHFIFHDWIPHKLMPQFYSLGAVTLALGHFVESFGNAVYESLGCGTPAIAARVATHRTLLPDALLDKVHFNDADTAAALAADIIRTKRRTSPAIYRALQAQYSSDRQLAAYADAILNARRRAPLTYRPAPLTEATRFRLAPWCYGWEEGIYHDYLAEHRQLPMLSALLHALPDGFTRREAAQQGVDGADFDLWYREGYIVPLPAA